MLGQRWKKHLLGTLEGCILWDQKTNSCPIHENLKEEHFQLNPSPQIRNGLAEDVLNKKMLYLMKVMNILYVYIIHTYIFIPII